MTISLDTEIVASRYDDKARMNYYTIERGGRRWTVSVPRDDFARYGLHNQAKPARRNHLGRILEQAMLGPADGE